MNMVPPIQADYFSARDIARATGRNKKFIQRAAEREGWPARPNGNRFDYQPPAEIAALIIATPSAPAPVHSSPLVHFADLSHSDDARGTVLLREQAVQLLNRNLNLGKEVALQMVCNHFAEHHPMLRVSLSSLRRWCDLYAAAGLDGLVEQKRGRVGRRAYADDLSSDQVLQLSARAVEYGAPRKGSQSGVLNTARAYRDMIASPTLNGAARAWLHGNFASKSYVPPSVRAAVRANVSQNTATLLQVGPKAMKLDGPYTECSYADVPPGKAFTADDMTANVYVWCEWPTESGFLLIRPQLLCSMDVGSMAWLEARVVIRPKGQYNRDDVWGLIGDTLDKHGLFEIAVLEGGTWQSDVVIGHKTGLTDESRFGGLRALGVKVIHTHTPKGKIIETAFNSFQHAADNCRGYCGRMEMKDCPEAVKQQKALVERGHAHPRQFFMHVSEFSNHIAAAMKNLNEERNDGKICQGRAPVDVWAEVQPTLRAMPENSKWMYRSAYNVREVTRNGVRVTQGTGKYQTSYTYTNPALEAHRGRRVVIWWNDYDPNTDAVVYTLSRGKPDQFICVASRVDSVPRFGTTEEQFKAEATRKKLSQQLAHTQSRSLAPFLQRSSHAPDARPQTPDPNADIAERIQRARAEAASKKATQQNVRRFAGDASELLAEPQSPSPRSETQFDAAGDSKSAINRLDQAASAPESEPRAMFSTLEDHDRAAVIARSGESSGFAEADSSPALLQCSAGEYQSPQPASDLENLSADALLD